MRRFNYFAISSVVAVTLLSFISIGSVKPSELFVGQAFPQTEIAEPHKGELVLVNFWAAYDAASRDKNVRLSMVVKKFDEKAMAGSSRLKSISISMDRFPVVFEEVVKQDGLNFSEVALEADGFQSKLAKDLKLNNQFGNFLVDEQGKIIAKDFTPEELERMLDRYLD
ncbi:MAG: thioredoxin family protein [Paludibacteraceae bacterium]|nr:thioredoxin family protein [Paludibacteraceae bacterium]